MKEQENENVSQGSTDSNNNNSGDDRINDVNNGDDQSGSQKDTLKEQIHILTSKTNINKF